MSVQRRYLTAPQVCERYGGRSAMWLWRRLKNDPRFPRPLKIGNRSHFEVSELDAYDDACRKASSNGPPFCGQIHISE
jgi:predicted DNA-binding transcriptional regulator AlpA